MPNNATLRRQRTLGGALGVIVLGFALTYHFFPRLFHVNPIQAPRRSMSLGAATPGEVAQRAAGWYRAAMQRVLRPTEPASPNPLPGT